MKLRIEINGIDGDDKFTAAVEGLSLCAEDVGHLLSSVLEMSGMHLPQLHIILASASQDIIEGAKAASSAEDTALTRLHNDAQTILEISRERYRAANEKRT